MSRKITRRGVLLGGAQVAAATGLATFWPGAYDARAAMEELTIVEWGGPYVKGMKQIVERQGKYDVTWELHAGGSAAILPKIKAQWPDRMLYDLVAGWPPVWFGMIREGWAEPLTVEAVPNLAHVPEALITKDKEGTWFGTPRNTLVSYFGYRPDLCPIEINSVEDFLDPKLKDQICWPDPVYNTNMQMVGLALARGGDEFNLDPGWEFMKEIAKAGNIGRVFKTEVDMINSISTGETSVTFGPSGNWAQLARKLPIVHLNKSPGAGLQASLATEGWCVMKGQNTTAAFDFVNHTLDAEVQTWWSQHLGNPPVNVNASASEELAHLVYTDEELAQYTHLPDWDFVSQQVDGWVKRFEQEIVPLALSRGTCDCCPLSCALSSCSGRGRGGVRPE